MYGIFGHKPIKVSIEEFIRTKLDEEIKICINKVKKQVENKIRSTTGAIYTDFFLNDCKYDINNHKLTVNVNYKNIGAE